VLLVALAVALGIRTFFLQPFKIPTGSMQPTLFGITSERLTPDFKIPTGWERFRQGLSGVSYVHFVADTDGRLERLYPPVGLGKQGSIFRLYQQFVFAGQKHTIWFPPDCGGPERNLAVRSEVQIGQRFKRGEDVFKVAVRSGDHLFVDRFSYNFRSPSRGEIAVFETKGIIAMDNQGINRMPQDQFYIKRLVGMGGETIKIGNDRHIVINGTNRLTAATPHFEFVYGFNPKLPPKDSQFSGHVNQKIYGDPLLVGSVARLFPDGDAIFQIPTKELMVMGDNTMSSFDSRAWGSFPARNVIGKYCFVYWPLSERFGWGQR
jgi:signal peptidase I